jgi:c(7)-type cytochrome triheme protein
MPNVVFPHFPHTYWLDCGNCHPDIFVMKKGANPISMVKIVNGEFCGRCHGRVAFPISNCSRCHVKPKT